MEDFRCEPKGKELNASQLNATDDPSAFEIEEVIELESFDQIQNLKPGLIFYPEDKAGES